MEIPKNFLGYKRENGRAGTRTHVIIIHVDDISNGAAYFYDNKIIIWTSPLDFELRGSFCLS